MTYTDTNIDGEVQRCAYPSTVRILRHLRRGDKGAELLTELRGWISFRDPWEPEAFEADVCEALYWFCVWNYSGQTDPRYAAQCANPFHPGPIDKGPEPECVSSDILDALQTIEDR